MCNILGDNFFYNNKVLINDQTDLCHLQTQWLVLYLQQHLVFFFNKNFTNLEWFFPTCSSDAIVNAAQGSFLEIFEASFKNFGLKKLNFWKYKFLSFFF